MKKQIANILTLFRMIGSMGARLDTVADLLFAAVSFGKLLHRR